MFSEGLQFHHVIFFLAIIFVVVRLTYALKFKRDAKISTLEKTVWEFKFACGVFAIFVLAAMYYLPFPENYLSSNIESLPQDVALHQLVKNQQDIGKQFDQIREIVFYVLPVMFGFFWSVISFVGAVQNEWHKGTFASGPQRKKILDL